MAKYKYVRNLNSYDYTVSIDLERNAAGEVTKAVGIGQVVDLTPVEYAKVSSFAEFTEVKDSSEDSELKKPEKGNKTTDR